MLKTKNTKYQNRGNNIMESAKNKVIEFTEDSRLFDGTFNIIVDGRYQGKVTYFDTIDRYYWSAYEINTLQCGVYLASYDEAKIHCFNTLNILLNGALVETKTVHQLELGLAERKLLVGISQIPYDELQKLVFCTYNCGEITEGRAMQILNVDKQEFETLLDGWCIA